MKYIKDFKVFENTSSKFYTQDAMIAGLLKKDVSKQQIINCLKILYDYLKRKNILVMSSKDEVVALKKYYEDFLSGVELSTDDLKNIKFILIEYIKDIQEVLNGPNAINNTPFIKLSEVFHNLTNDKDYLIRTLIKYYFYLFGKGIDTYNYEPFMLKIIRSNYDFYKAKGFLSEGQANLVLKYLKQDAIMVTMIANENRKDPNPEPDPFYYQKQQDHLDRMIKYSHNYNSNRKLSNQFDDKINKLEMAIYKKELLLKQWGLEYIKNNHEGYATLEDAKRALEAFFENIYVKYDNDIVYLYRSVEAENEISINKYNLGQHFLREDDIIKLNSSNFYKSIGVDINSNTFIYIVKISTNSHNIDWKETIIYYLNNYNNCEIILFKDVNINILSVKKIDKQNIK